MTTLASNNTLLIYKYDIARFLILFLLVSFALMPAKIIQLLIISFFLIYLISKKFIVSKKLFNFVFPLICLVLLGAINSYENSVYAVGKDLWYVGNVILTVGLGYYLADYITDFKVVCRFIIVAAVISAIIHYVELLFYIKKGMSFFELRRNESIRGYFITVIGLALLLALSKNKKNIFENIVNYYLSIMITFGSVLLSFSRTSYIVFLVMFLVLKGWGGINVKNIMRVLLFAGVVALVLLTGVFEGDSSEKNLVSKFAGSIGEVTIKNYEDKKDISLNWRGFESYRALVDFQGSNFLQKMIGQGLGSTIDLGFYMNLGESEIRYIPKLHNGYMFILVKFGVIGVMFYLYFIIKLIKYNSKHECLTIYDVMASRIISGFGWIFLLTTIVISGVFNANMYPYLLLIGMAYSYSNKNRYLKHVQLSQPS